MSPHVSSPRLRPTWSPSFRVACMVLMFGRLQALLPSEATPLKRSEEHRGLSNTPFFPGVLTTPLTTTTRACRLQRAVRSTACVRVSSSCPARTRAHPSLASHGPRAQRRLALSAMRGPLLFLALFLRVSSGISVEEKPISSTCEAYCSMCDETPLTRVQCYSEFLNICKVNFESEMENVSASDWCTWDNVKSPYNKFTMCSEDIAECLALAWPNRLVEDMFVDIHLSFFQECHTETLRDPPPNVIFALVMTPICLIPAMVVLVVLKTKNGDRSS